MNTHGTAADLIAVDYHIVGISVNAVRIVLKLIRGNSLGGCKGMMHGGNGTVLVLLEHREIHHPESTVPRRHQAEFLCNPESQSSNRGGNLVFVSGGSEENNVSGPGSGTFQNAPDHFGGQELGNGRLH